MTSFHGDNDVKEKTLPNLYWYHTSKYGHDME